MLNTIISNLIINFIFINLFNLTIIIKFIKYINYYVILKNKIKCIFTNFIISIYILKMLIIKIIDKSMFNFNFYNLTN